jgi:hypothetical protein
VPEPDGYDDGPIPEYYETGAGFSEPVREHGSATPPQPSAVDVEPSDLTRLLTESLGAQIVAEHAGPADIVAPGEGDDDEAAAELASAGPNLMDEPGLFDEDPREDN